jgi:ABC-2 type transport system ATP-binding protein
MPAIDICNVVKKFRNIEVLHGVTLQVQPGEIVGLVGPSGCGKTTLVDLTVGLTTPTAGSVTLNGERAPYSTARKLLGYMPQDTALYEDITALDNIRFFGSLYGMSRQEITASATYALTLARLPENGRKVVSTFSGGMKRRLSLAIAILNKPQILVMDEPTVGLDPVHRAALWSNFRLLAQEGGALLVTTHIMDEAAHCDRVALMRDGRLICCDTPEAITAYTGTTSLEDAFITLACREEMGGFDA